MPEYSVQTLPETHRRAREVLLKRWSADVDESSPTWLVTIGGKKSVVTIGKTCIVVVTPGLTGSEYKIAFDRVRRGDAEAAYVGLADSVGHVEHPIFEQASDADSFVQQTQLRITSAIEASERYRQALEDIVVVTTETVPGYRTVSLKGDVFGVVVRARNVFSNMAAGLRTVAGGEAAGYTKLITDTRNEARARLAAAAVAVGANAVVAMRYSSSEVADLMSETTAYGTAVTIEPLR
ncbi:heavy metal-binding domain-containing protein [Pseudonocardia alni]|uniref:heavy metal-binding domain-containing protein n=1 Tax=Pseudonocardia alni TaxID=33907 RepID=UPI0033292E0E